MRTTMLFLLTFLFANCQSQKSLCEAKIDTSQIKDGKLSIEVINHKNKHLKIPKEINNNALIITEFQKLVEDGEYEDIERSIIHFDCITPCFPLNYTLKKGEAKIYNFTIFNTNIVSKNTKYRIKLYMEDYFNCGRIKTDWIYFEIL
ncbi:hypothetical protein [Epilithonimonas caeni]|uniref:hypothetical protein n=1 Tax=Epilithonimonas caeni TaxID=365343 RepID=UPI00040E691E|nr:hypothetical protein [Epilithonimonas caeni]